MVLEIQFGRDLVVVKIWSGGGCRCLGIQLKGGSSGLGIQSGEVI